MNHKERRHLEALQRRADFLREKIAQWDVTRNAKRPDFYQRELTALEWVFDLVDEIEEPDEEMREVGT